MALTSYGAHNLVIEQDYNLRFSEIVAGEPEVTVRTLSGGNPTVSIDTWRRFSQEETARWRYVGMEYNAAKNAADSIRTQLTHNAYEWRFGTYLSGGHLQYGYYKEKQAPVLESDVTVVKNGNGAMYDVLVDAHMTDVNYSTEPIQNAQTTQLQTYLNTLTGWNDYPSGWQNGHDISAASYDNLVLVAAPTRTRSFEIAGQDILPIGGTGGLSSITFPVWYKCTDSYVCQVKYTGMTLAACRSLYSSLNSANGWYYSYHPYVYKYNSQWQETQWQTDNTKTLYQCLNEFKATKGDGNMWTAELNLHVDTYEYMRNPQYASSPNWPQLWRTKIPGLSAYL